MFLFDSNDHLVKQVFLRVVGAAIMLAVLACGGITPGTEVPEDTSVTTQASSPNTIVLTHAQPSHSAEGSLTAPGHGKQSYTVYYLDTTDFTEGGTLTIQISLGEGESDASFDLFPADAPIPTEGRAEESIAALYDLKRGESGSLSYQFSTGQVFQFGATGNWFSREGATNTFEMTVSVRAAGTGGDAPNYEALLALRPFKPTDPTLFFPSVYTSDLPLRDATGDPPSEDQARQMLQELLQARFPSDPDKVKKGIDLYNDPETFLKISSPSLRAAFVALLDTAGDPAIDYILHATTSKGNPKFVLVRFSKFPENRSNTIGMAIPGQFDDPEQVTIEINEKFQAENPFLFTDTIAHEALHDDESNSIVEEEINYTFDTLVYLELLAYYPELAQSGTWLSRWMNTNALSRLNSGAGSELGLYDTNGNQPIWPGSDTETVSFDERFTDNPGRDSVNPGNDLLRKFLERVREQDSQLPSQINFSVETLHWISDNQAELTPEELIAAASALKLDIPELTQN